MRLIFDVAIYVIMTGTVLIGAAYLWHWIRENGFWGSLIEGSIVLGGFAVYAAVGLGLGLVLYVLGFDPGPDTADFCDTYICKR